MLIIFCIGFLIGLWIPATGSRFGKVDLIDPGTVLFQLWHKRVPVSAGARQSPWYQVWVRRQRAFLLSSVLWGFFLGGLWVLSAVVQGDKALGWNVSFITIVCFLMVIDAKHYILPDFLTIPLLLLGFCAAYFGQTFPVSDSLIGALFGYGVSMTAVFMALFFKNTEFGAGDAKMLTALGAWTGIYGLNAIVLLSFIFFFIQTRLQKRSWGAYGPALGAAALVIFFNISFIQNRALQLWEKDYNENVLIQQNIKGV